MGCMNSKDKDKNNNNFSPNSDALTIPIIKRDGLHMITFSRDINGKLQSKRHIYTGPFSENEKKISNWNELKKINWRDITPSNVKYTNYNYVPENSVDLSALLHDIAYELIPLQEEGENNKKIAIIDADKIFIHRMRDIIDNDNEGLNVKTEALIAMNIIKVKLWFEELDVF